MSNVVAMARDQGELIESVIAKGDLAKLTPGERAQYYTEVCRSVGLNPLTQPFAYITLNGKLTLYALRGCTDQLRAIHKVSVLEMNEDEREGVCIVTCKVQNGEGRTDMAKGAVTISNLKGDALANAIMKAETKAKRRATLSICGLGMLDETEIETIPAAARKAMPVAETTVEPHNPETGEIIESSGLITPEQITELQGLIVETAANLPKYFALVGYPSLPEIPAGEFARAKQILENRKNMQAQKAAGAGK